MRPRFCHLAAVLLASVSMAAFAQTIPDSAQPGQIERQFRVIERPEVGGAPVITSGETEQKPLRGDAKFLLKNIVLEGATAFDHEELKPLYADMIGQTVSVGAMQKLAADITAFYRNRGFILSRAVLPPQRIDSGSVRIKIIEGFVNEVRINGDIAEGSVIYDYADKIRSKKPLNAADLERYLLLMEDVAGVSARAVLQPSAVQGASDVLVTISRKAVEAYGTIDNRGSRFLGQYQAGIGAAANNLFGYDEQTELRLIGTIFELDELKYGQIRHEFPVGSEGTKVALSASHVRSEPGASLEPLDIEGTSSTFTAAVSHPFLRSRQENLFGSLEGAIKNIDTEALGTDLYEDKLRTLAASGAYDFIDSLSAVNRLAATLTKGFGTSSDPATSRANGEESFWKVGTEISRLQPISGPWSAFGAVSGQYSADPLLASEEFALGGANFGSAYDTAEVTGDSGLAARLELQYSEAANWSFLEQYQLYGFYDVGRVWNRDIVAASEEKQASLASAGVGSRLNFNDALSGSLEVAVPLTRDVNANGTDGDDTRAFFALQYRY